ncbi:NAD(P)H-dependent oxidoreductase [Cellvibrio sp. PSBB006]|jgi:putative NADPH-quinone reductase|uniref:NAD(P)H-dependent oxidoreductase n=1 Tax=Cellvibrio sp. PSBB006 TaxID=1987723 RepID=UPI000B3B92EB|nr:NAD(P)H-dependent oxidoreductase [Cellvibrio sp. PSBB006]ARU28424.1 dehydrogenase [Cellvibrio sp. PSBB006]
MGKRILLLQGHPDGAGHHLCHALERAYQKGAADAGHDIRQINIAALDFPLLRSQQDWEHGKLPAVLQPAQQDIHWAEHLVMFFPLWLGDMPALVKGFLEQVARPGFAFNYDDKNPFGKKGLTGRSARVVVTMGMPAVVYRWFYRAHSVKSLERNILGFVGFSPINETLVGLAGNMKKPDAQKWLIKLEKLGASGE